MAAGLVMMAGCESSSRSLVGPSATKCALSIPGSPPPLGAAGGSGSLPVTAERECTWSATTPTPWISISQGTGQGDGVVRYTVAANPLPSRRQGELIIGEERTGIVQEGACLFAVTPTSYGLGADGGVFPVTVRTDDNCAWSATADAGWVEVEGPADFSGPATVRVHVEANTLGDRRATLRIAGQDVAIDQAGPSADCQTAITPADASVAAEGGALTVTVTATGGCQWTAASQNAWITVTSGPTGSGPGVVALAVEPNPGEARVGTVVVAGRTFTVMQASGAAPTCSYSLAPSARSFGAGGGDVAVTVTTQDGCAWSAASQAAWITVTSGGNGSGNGTVGLAVAANTGPGRVGTVTIGGQTVTVTQAAAGTCSLSLSSPGQSLGAAGGTSSVGVTAPAGCGWTATSEAPWITVTGGASGSGDGTVSLEIAANSGAERVGEVTIGGQRFTVTQAAGVTCSFDLSSSGQSVGAGGGNSSVGVAAPSGCGWTATSEVGWITVTGGASGSGNGTVNLAIAANAGGERAGAVTIAGQVFTVTQAAAAAVCSYTLNPPAHTVPLIPLGSFTFTVETQPGCAWTAVSENGWITIASGGSGAGSGTVTYSAGIALLSRTGSITVAGQTHTVHQGGLLLTPEGR